MRTENLRVHKRRDANGRDDVEHREQEHEQLPQREGEGHVGHLARLHRRGGAVTYLNPLIVVRRSNYGYQI